MEFVHNTAFYKITYKVTKKNQYMQIILHNLGEMGWIVARMQRKWNRKKREPDDSRTEHKRMMLHKSPI